MAVVAMPGPGESRSPRPCPVSHIGTGTAPELPALETGGRGAAVVQGDEASLVCSVGMVEADWPVHPVLGTEASPVLSQAVLAFRKDPHGFFAFPVTDAIAPGYSMIIKHPMDFGTMRDKIVANEYKSVTEFKVNSFTFWNYFAEFCVCFQYTLDSSCSFCSFVFSELEGALLRQSRKCEHCSWFALGAWLCLACMTSMC